MTNDIRRWIRLCEAFIDGTWYHGTGTLKQLQSIAAKGLQPRRSNYRGAMQSVAGRVYLSKYPIVAQDYSLRKQHNPPYSYIAQFNAVDLANVHPDEDAIVRFLTTNTRAFIDRPPEFDGKSAEAHTVWRDLTATLSAEQIASFRTRNLRAATQIAKDLLSRIAPDSTRYLIAQAITVAVEGTLHPSECWVIPVGKLQGVTIPAEAIRLADFDETRVN